MNGFAALVLAMVCGAVIASAVTAQDHDDRISALETQVAQK